MHDGPVGLNVQVDPAVEQAELGHVGHAPQPATFCLSKFLVGVHVVLDAAVHLETDLGGREDGAAVPERLDLRHARVELGDVDGAVGEREDARLEERLAGGVIMRRWRARRLELVDEGELSPVVLGGP